MTKIEQIIFIALLLIGYNSNSQNLVLGSEKVKDYYPYIKEQRVAVVGNQTSMIHQTHLVDSLISLGVEVVKVFSPEHGFRGQADAGANVSDGIDIKTGRPIISLYGEKGRKPTKDQLNNIDIIIFDIQDVGARFYTYISTLHYVMEAASEHNIPLIVLDRPNPNGHYIDGPVRKKEFKSFVGMHPVPIVHGMTIGEYALMINGENWIASKCNLRIIKMENYNRKAFYDLPVKPSPNLPNAISINLYPSLCLFEGTNVSVGRGTKYPFQQFGAPYVKSKYSFIPESNIGSKNPKYKDIKCYGTNLKNQKEYLQEIKLDWLIETYKNCPDKEVFFNSFFDKLSGNDTLRTQIIAGFSASEIKKSWTQDLVKFNKKRMKYLLY